MSVRQTGEFCWINMLTPDTAKAREFFAGVLGWTYTEIPGMGHAIKVGGQDVGGLFDVVSPRTPNGMPPVIGVMVKVDSADDVAARVTALGGKADTPFDIMTSGRMAVCHDPNGAQFDLWEPKQMPGTAVEARHHGAPSWFETITTDVDRARTFYTMLFGWRPQVHQMDGFEYTEFKLGQTPVAGMLEIRPEMEVERPHWGVYFTVNNVDEATAKAADLGATVCVQPTDIPGTGRFSGLVSPQGVVFYVITYQR